MRRDQLITALLDRYSISGGQPIPQLTPDEETVAEIYLLATEPPRPDYSKTENERLTFRAAYVLEKICLDHSQLFLPYIDRFFEDYNLTTNESAKRHFAKMMAHILKQQKPRRALCEQIAETSAAWVASPTTRVAVQIWAMRVLEQLQGEVDWLVEIFPQLVETLSRNPPAAMRAYLWSLR